MAKLRMDGTRGLLMQVVQRCMNDLGIVETWKHCDITTHLIRTDYRFASGNFRFFGGRVLLLYQSETLRGFGFFFIMYML
ncbi:MAG TPA: hypothetical protein VF272_03380 [Candidatus Saccharimonadia bacterium]